MSLRLIRSVTFAALTILLPVAGFAFDEPDEEWSVFQPLPETVSLPEVDSADWSANPLDRWIYTRLREEGLTPAPVVDRRTWLRRVTFDLIGLPPTPDEVEAFLKDGRPDPVAYSAVVDRLLASPHYGERWARHWLDVARYADTDGFAIDGERSTLWRYRDYVIRVFNEDRPYDRFIREQIAGDEIDAGSEGIVATSFYRLGPYELDNMTPENRRQDFLNEMTTAVGNAFLGVTVGCAICHDHKFDPITQRDFYSLQAFLAPVEREDVPAEFLDVELSGTSLGRMDAVKAELAERRKAYEDFKVVLKEKIAKAREKPLSEITEDDLRDAVRKRTDELTDEDREKIRKLKDAVDDYHEGKRFEAVAVTVENSDKDEELTETHILYNGNVFAPGDKVQPAFLSAVEPWSSEVFQEVKEAEKTAADRRRILADWIASPQNPLTARVFVNRVWHHHFGRGIVATTNDFGVNGSGVTHPELLDYLARWFIEGGWKVKPLHRLMVLSRSYRMSTVHPHPEQAAEKDPDNRLLWRANYRRLESETIRDAMLAVSGRLNPEQGGPGFFEALPDEMRTKYPFFEWHASSDVQRARRSIYMYQRRNLIHPMMEVFDKADMNQSCGRRKSSVTAPQVLTLFNGDLAHTMSRHFARRVLEEAGEKPQRQVERIFRLAYARSPESDELEDCIRFLEKRRARHEQTDAEGEKQPADNEKNQPQRDPQFAALTDLCLVILNTNEFLYLQ